MLSASLFRDFWLVVQVPENGLLVFQSPAVTANVEHLAFVHKAVHHCSGDHVVTEGLSPVIEAFVGDDNQGRLLVKVRDQLE
jgi:hypothetical protein